MKKLFNIITLLALAFNLIPAPGAFAASRVQFEGGAENFVFYPDGDFSDTDLFGGMKNMMTGDIRTETIIVRNLAREYDYVKIYLRAEPADPSAPACEKSGATMLEFLTNFNLELTTGGTTISKALASEKTETIPLGIFYPGEETHLKVDVTALDTLGNKFQHCQGEINWIFTAEGFSGTNTNPSADSPDTGFLTKPEDKVILASTLLAAIIFATILIARKQSKKK